MQLHAKPSSTDEDLDAFEHKNAANQFYMRARAGLPYQVNLTAELRFVGRIPGKEIAAYGESNLHVSRSLRKGLRLNVTLDNLMHSRHAEWDFGDALTPSRGVRASLSWQF
jgi:hypothetical protein